VRQLIFAAQTIIQTLKTDYMKTLLLLLALLLPCLAAAQNGKSGEPPTGTGEVMAQRMEILLETGRSEEALELFKVVAKAHDSIRNGQFADLRAAGKERSDSGFLFLLAGCLLFATVQRIWTGREIKRKILAVVPDGFPAWQEVRNAGQRNRTDSSGRKTAGDNDGLCPESRADRLCSSIRNFILKDKAYRNPGITRDYAVEQLATNRELFVEAFGRCFGMSFSKCINTLRLKDAVALLRQSDMSIEAVSEETGFGSVRTFQRQFRKQYGMSPKDYRRATQNGKQE
jgi:AraC-like DNA-binding protein